MKKEELQTGMVLEFENGHRAMVIRSVYGDGIYYAGDDCNEQDHLNIISDDLEHTSCYAPNYGKVMRVLKTGRMLAEMRPEYMAKTCKNASIILWERVVYPRWFRAKRTGQIVKFTGLTTGTTVVTAGSTNPVGCTSNLFIPHNASETWEEVSEPVKELTMAELEEALGYKVKIKG